METKQRTQQSLVFISRNVVSVCPLLSSQPFTFTFAPKSTCHSWLSTLCLMHNSLAIRSHPSRVHRLRLVLCLCCCHFLRNTQSQLKRKKFSSTLVQAIRATIKSTPNGKLHNHHGPRTHDRVWDSLRLAWMGKVQKKKDSVRPAVSTSWSDSPKCPHNIQLCYFSLCFLLCFFPRCTHVEWASAHKNTRFHMHDGLQAHTNTHTTGRSHSFSFTIHVLTTSLTTASSQKC